MCSSTWGVWVVDINRRPDARAIGNWMRSKVPNSSGDYICKSIVNYLRHGTFTCKSEVMYLPYEDRIVIPVEFTYVNQ